MQYSKGKRFLQTKYLQQCLLSVIIILMMSGCVTTQTPKISHVHVGHAMTAWRDTPDEQGLFITAEKEGTIAYKQALSAVENSHSVKLLKMHIKHVQHAMNPKLAKEGPGLGYGFISAISSARDHILFAADSKDASANIKSSAEVWSKHVESILERSNLVIELSKEILVSSSHEEMIILTDEVLSLTKKNLYGYDSDGDGTIGNVKNDYGIKQLHEEMKAMIAREDPPYQTVDKKYLFGLIRLPSGEWIFRSNSNSTSSSDGLYY